MISIIIPTYNSAKTINRCLDSIITQTNKDCEVLVMDGVSKDDTLSLVQSYNDSRIHIYSEPDKGIYDAMNKGIKRAKGDWLYFLGSDDYLYAPDVLEKVAKELTPEYKIVYGEVEAPHLSSEYRGMWYPQMMEYNRCHQAIFYHKSIFEKYDVYDLSYRVYADHMFNLQCFWEHHVPAKYIDVVIAYYSDGGASTSEIDPQYNKEIYLLLLQLGSRYFTIKQRKEYAYGAIRNNDSKILHIALHTYIFYQRLIAKIFNKTQE